jgi:hypothetical protein
LFYEVRLKLGGAMELTVKVMGVSMQEHAVEITDPSKASSDEMVANALEALRRSKRMRGACRSSANVAFYFPTVQRKLCGGFQRVWRTSNCNDGSANLAKERSHEGSQHNISHAIPRKSYNISMLLQCYPAIPKLGYKKWYL